MAEPDPLWHSAFFNKETMKTRFLFLCLVTTALFVDSAHGAIVYDNTENFEELFNDSSLESGDEILLGGTARLVTEFSFEYYGEFATSGDETARVRFYQMNGAPGNNAFATPGTLLYESAAFNIASGYKSVTISDLALYVPGDAFTWSVEFGGVTAQESVGLLYYDPPTVGTSAPYFWEKENGVWSAVATEDAGNNFAARVTAVDALQIAQVRNVGNGAAVSVVGATAGRTYTLEYKTTVTQVGWQTGPSAVAGGSELTLTDPTAAGATFRLYRVRES